MSMQRMLQIWVLTNKISIMCGFSSLSLSLSFYLKCAWKINHNNKITINTWTCRDLCWIITKLEIIWIHRMYLHLAENSAFAFFRMLKSVSVSIDSTLNWWYGDLFIDLDFKLAVFKIHPPHIKLHCNCMLYSATGVTKSSRNRIQLCTQIEL